MTAIDSSEDEYKEQAKFVSQLKQFAMKFKCCVLLVSHPRKETVGQKFTNDSVAGSSAITNLADVVMSIEKPNIRLTKNREFGSTPYIICNYNPANHRIYEAVFGDKTVYSWNHEGIEIPEHQAIELDEFAIQQGVPEDGVPLI